MPTILLSLAAAQLHDTQQRFSDDSPDHILPQRADYAVTHE